MKMQKANKPFPNIKRVQPKNKKEENELAKSVARSLIERQEYLEKEQNVRIIGDPRLFLS